MAGATLMSLVNGNAVHVPLKASVESPLSLLRGDTDFAFTIAGTAISQVRGGKLRALAVTSAAALKELPNVPPLRDALYSEFTVQEFWFRLWVPQKTPAEVIDSLHRATSKVLTDPAVKDALETAGNSVIHSDSPKADAMFVRSEQRKGSEIIKLNGVTAG